MSQCAMPAFEGLFLDTRVDDFVQDLLFELAMFYTFARLAMHTEGTLHAFDLAVVSLGKAMRNFLAKVCPKFDTRELSGETESRQRRRQRKGKTMAHILGKNSWTSFHFFHLFQRNFVKAYNQRNQKIFLTQLISVQNLTQSEENTSDASLSKTQIHVFTKNTSNATSTEIQFDVMTKHSFDAIEPKTKSDVFTAHSLNTSLE